MKDIAQDLEYLVGKYIAATSTGKANPRLANQIRIILDANEIYLEAKADLAQLKIEFEEDGKNDGEN